MSLESKKLFFVRVNKTGSSSLVSWLTANKIKISIHQFQWNRSRLLHEIKNPNTTFFSVVRNPWDRAVSSWKLRRKEHNRRRDLAFGDISFREFLQLPFRKMTPFQRSHSIPQYRYLVGENGGLSYLSHIGRLENINASLSYIAKAAGISDFTEFPHENKSNDREPSYIKYYTDETRETVLKKYAKDIEHFGYKFGE